MSPSRPPFLPPARSLPPSHALVFTRQSVFVVSPYHLTIPTCPSLPARVRRLLCDAAHRFGRDDDESEVREHPWFAELNLDTLRSLPAPFVPELSKDYATTIGRLQSSDIGEVEQKKLVAVTPPSPLHPASKPLSASAHHSSFPTRPAFARASPQHLCANFDEFSESKDSPFLMAKGETELGRGAGRLDRVAG